MLSRTIATVGGQLPGPTLILVGGVHGNEPAGIVAAQQVLASVRPEDVRGEAVALVGNLQASAASTRFLVEDFNRMWKPERLAQVRALNAEQRFAEVRELVELADAIDAVIARATGPVFLIDLHTTSAEGIPFAVAGSTAAHRRFALALGLPGVVGLEEALAGVLTGYYGARGCITLAIEGGQSRSAAAAAHLAAAVTVALEISGVIAAMPGAAAARAHLAQARGFLPSLIEVVSRHAVRPSDDFRMEPGFANLALTSAGTLLARDRAGEIRAPFDGVVLLPLYQPQGEDGFFYGRTAD